MRCRRPKEESRAAEICAKLTRWKQMPESSRSSLRALARELGTSHQLLSHYLQRWEKWQAKEYRRRANEIRARAEAENRSLTAWEEQQTRAYDQAVFQGMIESALGQAVERDAKDGKLATIQVKMLRLLASRGHGKAQKILEKLSGAEKSKSNLPVLPPRAAKSFRSHRRVAGNSAKTFPRVSFVKIEGLSEN